jgi:hypothetical protein
MTMSLHYEMALYIKLNMSETIVQEVLVGRIVILCSSLIVQIMAPTGIRWPRL